jgi:hypothetical protein
MKTDTPNPFAKQQNWPKLTHTNYWRGNPNWLTLADRADAYELR